MTLALRRNLGRWLPLPPMVVLIALLSLQAYGPSAGGIQILAGDKPHYLQLITALPHHLHYLVDTGGFLVSAIGFGLVLLRPLRVTWRASWERPAFALAAGLALWSVLTMVLGFAGVLRFPIFLAAEVLGLLACAVELAISIRTRPPAMPHPPLRHLPALLILAAAGYLALLFALMPVVQWDAAWYHLGAPQHFVWAGRIYDIVRVTRVGAPGQAPYEEMLYTALLVLSDQVGAKLINWFLAVITAGLLIGIGREHLKSTAAGFTAAIIFMTVPQVVWSASTADNDMPIPFLTVLTLHAFLRWLEHRDWRWLALAGGAAGYAIPIKIFALFNLLLLMAGAVWQRAGLRAVALIGGIALVLSLPWFYYSARLTGNPIFPYVFPTEFWSPAYDANVRLYDANWSGPRSVMQLALLPWTLFATSQFRGVLGPLFAASIPAIALTMYRGASARLLRIMGVAVVAWLAGWYAAGLLEVRYLLGIVPLLALLAAAAAFAVSNRSLRATTMAAIIVGSVMSTQLLVVFSPDAAQPAVDARAFIDWDYTYGSKPASAVVAEPMVEFMNAHLTSSDKLYDGDRLGHDYLYLHFEIYNGWGWDSPAYLGQWKLTDADALQHLRENGVTYVLLSAQPVPGVPQSGLFGAPQDTGPVLESPLGSHLVEVPGVPEGGRLFRVVYDGV